MSKNKLELAFKQMLSKKKVGLSKKGVLVLEASKKGISKTKPTIISIHANDKVDLSFDEKKGFNIFHGVSVDCLKLK